MEKEVAILMFRYAKWVKVIVPYLNFSALSSHLEYFTALNFKSCMYYLQV
jgi:hypothetical protein